MKRSLCKDCLAHNVLHYFYSEVEYIYDNLVKQYMLRYLCLTVLLVLLFTSR